MMILIAEEEEEEGVRWTRGYSACSGGSNKPALRYCPP